jgi:membrane-bound lytic murein transglycosylase B
MKITLYRKIFLINILSLFFITDIQAEEAVNLLGNINLGHQQEINSDKTEDTIFDNNSLKQESVDNNPIKDDVAITDSSLFKKIQNAKVKLSLTNMNTHPSCVKKVTAKINPNTNKINNYNLSFWDKRAFRNNIYKSMIANGVSEELADTIMSNLIYIKQNVIIQQKQPEIKKDFNTYYQNYKIDEKVKQAKVYEMLYREKFNEIETIFNVNREIILTLWALETNFGKTLGNHDVANSLYTLAMQAEERGNKTRANFFIRNLVTLAKLIELGHIPYGVKGSWAGAIGNCQFMPESFYKYAMPFDQNESANILQNHLDTFASIANYLYNTGWNSSEPIITEVEIKLPIDKCLVGFNNKKTVSQWKTLGIEVKDNIQDDLITTLVVPDIEMLEIDTVTTKDKRIKAFLVHNNFVVLLSWNKATKYALLAAITNNLIKREILKSPNDLG